MGRFTKVIEWTLEETIKDYRRVKGRRCVNCSFGDSSYGMCYIKDSKPLDKGQLRAKLCKYYTTRGSK